MSAAVYRRLYGAKKEYGVPDDIFKAILLGQVGSESAKGITWAGTDACIAEFKKHNPGAALRKEQGKPEPKPKPDNWRKPATSRHARKVYVLWGILRRHGKVEARYPDAYVKRMTDIDRADFLTPAKSNIVIEGLKDWIEREGLVGELR